LIQEEGDINLYYFVGNNTITYYDIYGMEKDAACINTCINDLQKCYNYEDLIEYAFGGGAIGAALQGINKMAIFPGKARFLGGAS